MWLITAAAWAASEDRGPFPTGVEAFGLTDPASGRWVEGAIVYPALAPGGAGAAPDPSAGPFPLVAMLHGWTVTPADYERLADHVASWGFVVVLPGTNTGVVPRLDDYAANTAVMLTAVADASDAGVGLLAGLVGPEPWSAVGHSMGGATLAPLVGLEPRISVLVGLEASRISTTPAHDAVMATFAGAALYVGATDDTIVAPADVHAWFEGATVARRDLYVEVLGGDHNGPMDSGSPAPPLAHEEQHRLHRRLVTAFLRAEVRAEEDAYAEIFDPTEPLAVESRCAEPVLVWSAPAGTLVVTVAARPNQTAHVASATGPGAVPTPLGEVGLDVATATLLGSVALGADGLGDLPASPATWVQARVGHTLTRTVEIP